MSNRLTRAIALLGGLLTDGEGNARIGSGAIVQVKAATIARTDTATKNLFTLPANAIIHEIGIFGPAVSNAATTATISVGKAGANTFFVNGFDVKGVTGSKQQVPAADNLGPIGAADIQVTGIYAETGAASSAGGPWTVVVQYSVQNI